jgi:hypothetical protein
LAQIYTVSVDSHKGTKTQRETIYQKTFGEHSPRHRLAGNNGDIKDETSNEVKKNGEPYDVHRRCGDG